MLKVWCLAQSSFLRLLVPGQCIPCKVLKHLPYLFLKAASLQKVNHTLLETITTLRYLGTMASLLGLHETIKDENKPGRQTGSSIQDRMLRLPGFLHWWNWQKPKHATDWTQTSDKQWWRQQSHCWAPFTDETSNWLGLCDMYNVFYRLLSTSYFRKLVY